MEPNQAIALDDIDLSDLTFWGRPLEEREGAFKALRDERPVAWMPPPEIVMPSTIDLPPLTGYYAVTRYADVLEASKNPERFCSGKGATSQLDMPVRSNASHARAVAWSHEPEMETN